MILVNSFLYNFYDMGQYPGCGQMHGYQPDIERDGHIVTEDHNGGEDLKEGYLSRAVLDSAVVLSVANKKGSVHTLVDPRANQADNHTSQQEAEDLEQWNTQS